MTEPTCETCANMRRVEHDDCQSCFFECRAHPPTVFAGPGRFGRLPRVLRTDRCGEYRAKSEDAEIRADGDTLHFDFDAAGLKGTFTANKERLRQLLFEAERADTEKAYCPYCGDELELVRPGKHQPTGCCERAMMLQDLVQDMLAVFGIGDARGVLPPEDAVGIWRTRAAEASAEWGHK